MPTCFWRSFFSGSLLQATQLCLPSRTEYAPRRCAMRFLTRPGPADQSSRYTPWTSTSSDGCDDATFSKKVGRLPFRRRAVPVSGTERPRRWVHALRRMAAATFEGHAPVSHKGLSERSKARRRGHTGRDEHGERARSPSDAAPSVPSRTPTRHSRRPRRTRTGW